MAANFFNIFTSSKKSSQSRQALKAITHSQASKKPIKLFLHIGAGKTGSSLIQKFCQLNYKVLQGQKLLYPNTRTDYYNEMPPTNHAHLEEVPDNVLEQKLINLHEYCINNSFNKVLLSWEVSNWQRWGTKIYPALDKTEFHTQVIIYIRRQDTWWESAWKQWGTKSSNSITEYIYENLPAADWYQKLQPWIEAFGKENIILRVYEKEKVKNMNLLEDFFAILDINLHDGFEPVDKNDYNANNTGFKPIILNLIKKSKSLAKNVHDPKFFHFFDRNLSDTFKKPPFADYNYLTYQQRTKLLKSYEDSNNKLAQEFFPDQKEPLFTPPLKNNFSKNENKESSTEDYLLVIMDALLHIDERQQKLEADLKKLQNSNFSKQDSG